MTTDFRRLYTWYGACDLRESAGQCNCTFPHSQKPGKGFFNPTNGLWDEKHLGLSGNAQNLAGHVFRHHLDNTQEAALAAVAEWRGLSVPALRWWGFASDGEYVYDPITNLKGDVVSYRRCALAVDVRKWMGPPGVPIDVSGWGRLARAKPSSLVFLCEGSWDGAALNWLARAAGASVTVLALPGASVLKPEWAQRLAGFNVVCCYDADDAGAKAEQRAATVLSQFGVKPRFLDVASLIAEASR